MMFLFLLLQFKYLRKVQQNESNRSSPSISQESRDNASSPAPSEASSLERETPTPDSSRALELGGDGGASSSAQDDVEETYSFRRGRTVRRVLRRRRQQRHDAKGETGKADTPGKEDTPAKEEKEIVEDGERTKESRVEEMEVDKEERTECESNRIGIDHPEAQLDADAEKQERIPCESDPTGDNVPEQVADSVNSERTLESQKETIVGGRTSEDVLLVEPPQSDREDNGIKETSAIPAAEGSVDDESLRTSNELSSNAALEPKTESFLPSTIVPSDSRGEVESSSTDDASSISVPKESDNNVQIVQSSCESPDLTTVDSNQVKRPENLSRGEVSSSASSTQSNVENADQDKGVGGESSQTESNDSVGSPQICVDDRESPVIPRDTKMDTAAEGDAVSDAGSAAEEVDIRMECDDEGDSSRSPGDAKTSLKGRDESDGCSIAQETPGRTKTEPDSAACVEPEEAPAAMDTSVDTPTTEGTPCQLHSESLAPSDIAQGDSEVPEAVVEVTTSDSLQNEPEPLRVTLDEDRKVVLIEAEKEEEEEEKQNVSDRPSSIQIVKAKMMAGFYRSVVSNTM